MKGFLKGTSIGTSKCIFFALIILAVLVFGAFFLIGYRLPYEDNPAYNAPALTNVLLVFILLLLFATIGVCIWSIATHLRQRKAMGTENLVPVRKVTLFVVGGTVCLLLVSFLLASSSPIRINVADYEHTFWLKMAGMFVTASVVMIVVALCAILYDYVRHREN